VTTKKKRTRKRTPHRCSVCHETGHTRRGCTAYQMPQAPNPERGAFIEVGHYMLASIGGDSLTAHPEPWLPAYEKAPAWECRACGSGAAFHWPPWFAGLPHCLRCGGEMVHDSRNN
jgi:hypothetical protein